jgi:hypothetical protein
MLCCCKCSNTYQELNWTLDSDFCRILLPVQHLEGTICLWLCLSTGPSKQNKFICLFHHNWPYYSCILCMKVSVKVTMYPVTYSFKNGTSKIFFYCHPQKMSFCWDSFWRNEKSMLQKKLFMLWVFYICLSVEMANDGCVAYR